MAWTLTAGGARIANAVGLRGRWRSAYSVSHAAGLAQRGNRSTGNTVFARAYASRAAAATPADRKALDACRAQLVVDAEVIERAAASGAPLAAIAALAEGWERLPEATRGFIRSPLGSATDGPVLWGDTPATQVDQRTCGAAVIVMTLMITDPFVALWVTSGRLLADYAPSEVAVLEDLGGSLRGVEQRWHALQHAVHVASTRSAVAGFAWPQALGTPPWRVDNVMRVAGVRLRTALVDDVSAADVSAFVAHASAALREAIPVPMYTGGDSRMGIGAIVPRHVVLLTGVVDDVFTVYEPSSGALHSLPAEQWLADGSVSRALGFWSRISCLVLPSPRRRD